MCSTNDTMDLLPKKSLIASEGGVNALLDLTLQVILDKPSFRLPGWLRIDESIPPEQQKEREQMLLDVLELYNQGLVSQIQMCHDEKTFARHVSTLLEEFVQEQPIVGRFEQEEFSWIIPPFDIRRELNLVEGISGSDYLLNRKWFFAPYRRIIVALIKIHGLSNKINVFADNFYKHLKVIVLDILKKVIEENETPSDILDKPRWPCPGAIFMPYDEDVLEVEYVEKSSEELILMLRRAAGISA